MQQWRARARKKKGAEEMGENELRVKVKKEAVRIYSREVIRSQPRDPDLPVGGFDLIPTRVPQRSLRLQHTPPTMRED